RLLEPLKLSFKEQAFDFGGQSGEVMQSFRWIPLSRLKPEDMTYPIDRHVVKLILENPPRFL
ncbi:MAG TPA: NUDIX hydrolase, partial [Anseongella sp.]|nr:NUDIX hydrolase [Anseongella sp.]